MRARAELTPGLLRELQRSLSTADVEDFFRQLDWVCDDTIARSEMDYASDYCKYALHRFRFGDGFEKLATFHYNGTLVKVLRWRLSKPRRRRNAGHERPTD